MVKMNIRTIENMLNSFDPTLKRIVRVATTRAEYNRNIAPSFHSVDVKAAKGTIPSILYGGYFEDVGSAVSFLEESNTDNTGIFLKYSKTSSQNILR